MVVKGGIWAVSLGSGTSGGVLAPLLIMGSALGVVESHFLPAYGAGLWPLVSMAAILAGTMRAPLTAMVFAIELTGRFGVALPILTAAIVAHTFTVLALKRSILTEKVARRGFHVSREYAIDPLEILFVREVMRPEVVVLSGEMPLAAAAELLVSTARARAQGLYPVTDGRGGLAGVATRTDIEAGSVSRAPVSSIAREPIVARADEPVRAAIHRMAESGVSRMPVIDRAEPPALVGLITLKEALKARARHLEEERRRERVIPLGAIIPIARLLPARNGVSERRRRGSG
jgi:CBS domain-containing protein